MSNKTWRNVLDSYAPSRSWFGHIDNYLEIVDKTGYNYFNWNGMIYKIIRGKNLSYENTGILASEL